MPNPSRFWRLALRVSVPVFAASMLIGYAVYSQRVANPRRMMRGTKSTQVLEDLRQIDNAVDQWAIENGKANPPAAPAVDLQKYKETVRRLMTQAAQSPKTAIDDYTGSALWIDYSITPPKPFFRPMMMSSTKTAAVVRPEMVDSLLPIITLGSPAELPRFIPEYNRVPEASSAEELRPPLISTDTRPPQILQEAEAPQKSKPLMKVGSKSAAIFKAAGPAVPDLTLRVPVEANPPSHILDLSSLLAPSEWRRLIGIGDSGQTLAAVGIYIPPQISNPPVLVAHGMDVNQPDTPPKITVPPLFPTPPERRILMSGSKSAPIFIPSEPPAPQPSTPPTPAAPKQPAGKGDGHSPAAKARPLMAPGSKSIDMLLFGQSGAASVPGEATLDPNSPNKARFLEKPAPKLQDTPNAAAPAPAPIPAAKPASAKPVPKTGSIWPRPRSSFMAPSSKLGLIFFTPWGPVRSGPFVTAKIVDANGQPIVSDSDDEEPVENLPVPELAPGSLPTVNFKSVKPSPARP